MRDGRTDDGGFLFKIVVSSYYFPPFHKECGIRF
jgi:hypothetical protein